MNVKPIKKNVLVAENQTENKTDSGLILTGKNIGDTRTATVLAIGPDVTTVKVGDKVLLEWQHGTIVKIGDAQRVMIDEFHIMAVFE